MNSSMNGAMITPEYCRMMARYNRWQNNSLRAAAATLDDAAREADRGAFFGSVRATFSHLLWADTIWMSRLDGWTAPGMAITTSGQFAPDWPSVTALRGRADDRIIAWSERMHVVSGTVAWFSGALRREVKRPLALCIVHLFNHQTHHRGQIHAMLTAAGAQPGDTDLFILPEDV